MAKQTELAQLLKSHRAAVYGHIDAANAGATLEAGKVAAAFAEVNTSEKRIFSLFDKMQSEIDAAKRETEALRSQRDFIQCEVNKLRTVRLKPSVPSVPGKPVNIPFDMERARAGEAIQVLFDNVWRDVKYVGVGEHGHIVECTGTWATSKLSYWRVGTMRMKPKETEQLQMFATVYQHGDGPGRSLWGDLRIKADAEARIVPPGRSIIAHNVPVTITVAK